MAIHLQTSLKFGFFIHVAPLMQRSCSAHIAICVRCSESMDATPSRTPLRATPYAFLQYTQLSKHGLARYPPSHCNPEAF